MKRFPLKITGFSTLVSILVLVFALVAGCSGAPPKPVLPDGSHRVPVNVTAHAAASQGEAK